MKKNKKGEISVLDELVDLLERYEKGEVNDTERQALDTWAPNLDHPTGGKAYRKMIDHHTINVWKSLAAKFHFEHQMPVVRRSTLIPYYFKGVRGIAAAITLFVLIGVGSWFAYRSIDGTGNDKSMLAAVYKDAWTTTDREMSKVILPDGSTVRINAGSRLEIIQGSFNRQQREVWLSGEAFFEVAKNPDKPFIIHTGAMQTIVRGTSFNVKAYGCLHENEVSVRDGRVEVKTNGRMLALLTANRQLRYRTDNGTIKIEDADWHEAAGWTDGRLILNGASAEELVLRLKQQFGVDVIIKNEALKDTYIQGAFGRKSSLSEILNAISQLYDINYRIDGTRVTLYKE